MRPLTYDLLGQRFGRLLVVAYAAYKWLCRCDCGVEKAVASGHLREGRIVSCGCQNAEQVRKPKTHGLRYSRAWKSWSCMTQRCTNPKSSQYHNYGGRGIRVCQSWTKFEQFYADMGDPPPGMELERMNNDGDYELSNCRWATMLEQARNKRTTRFIEIDGQRRSLAEWCDLQRLPYARIYCRLRRGWTEKAALGFEAPVTNRPYLREHESGCFDRTDTLQAYGAMLSHTGPTNARRLS